MTWTKWVRVSSRVYWSCGDLVKEFVQRRAVEDPVQSDAGHDRGRGAVDKGVENGGQDQRSLPGRRFESSVTKEVTLEDLRMFTGVVNAAPSGSARRCPDD